jgi:membrane-associated phospholipid phosphatase
MVNPYLFMTNNPKTDILILISVVSLSVIFPLICIAMMKMLGLIPSINMYNNKERVGPLIATALFYLWLFVNIKDNDLIPSIFTYYLLGAVISLFIAFFINNFSKISLHAIAVGGFVMGMLFLRFQFEYSEFIFTLSPTQSFMVSLDIIIMGTILLAGIIGTSRMYLKAHSPIQLYGGYFVGAISHVIAYIAFIR